MFLTQLDLWTKIIAAVHIIIYHKNNEITIVTMVTYGTVYVYEMRT